MWGVPKKYFASEIIVNQRNLFSLEEYLRVGNRVAQGLQQHDTQKTAPQKI